MMAAIFIAPLTAATVPVGIPQEGTLAGLNASQASENAVSVALWVDGVEVPLEVGPNGELVWMNPDGSGLVLSILIEKIDNSEAT